MVAMRNEKDFLTSTDDSSLGCCTAADQDQATIRGLLVPHKPLPLSGAGGNTFFIEKKPGRYDE